MDGLFDTFIFKDNSYVRYGDFVLFVIPHARIKRGGGQGVPTPLENHKNIGFFSNTVPDPLKIIKLPS